MMHSESLSVVVLAEALQASPYAEYVKVIHYEREPVYQSAARWMACPWPPFLLTVL